jgi:hypothetical protein
MPWSVFYSWQSDSPASCNRTFIRAALDAAAQQLANPPGVEDSPRVDSGMEGIAGTPEVASVMFEKIQNSAIFVADSTLVGSIPAKEGESAKKIPNPNVLLEMGYAAGSLGWGRIICVMNEHFGTRQELPFDVRNRRFPINYILAPTDTEARAKARESLTKWLKFAIETVLANELSTARRLLGALDVNCLSVMHSFGTHPCFAAPNPNAFTLGGALDTARFNPAVTRLLDLGLIKADVNLAQDLYAYHWTYVGIQVLVLLGIRQAPAAPTGAPE